MFMSLFNRVESMFWPQGVPGPQTRQVLLVVRSALAVVAALVFDIVLSLVRRAPFAAEFIITDLGMVAGAIFLLFTIRWGYVRLSVWLFALLVIAGGIYALLFFGGVDRAVVLSPIVAVSMVAFILGVKAGIVVLVLYTLVALAVSALYTFDTSLPKVPYDEYGAVGLFVAAMTFLLFVIWTFEKAQSDAVAAALKSEQYVSGILDASPDGIVVVDRDGKIVRANSSTAKFLGVDLITIHSARLSSIPALAGLSDTHEGLFDIDVSIQDGQARVIEVNSSTNQALGERILLLRDVTDVRRAAQRAWQLEQELAEARRLDAIGRLAGGVAHDIRNMLTVILTNAEYVADSPELSPDAKSAAEDVRSAAIRATGVTSQLLAFARKDQSAPRIICIDESIEELNPLLRQLVRADITLTLDLNAKDRQIKADPTQVTRVIINLLANARDACSSGGKITVRTSYSEQRPHSMVSSAPGCVVLEINDNGAGMDTETKQHIFEPFFTTKPVGRGTGLGLATVHGVVSQLGGTIEVESELGKGSSFRVYLPIVGGDISQQDDTVPPSAVPHKSGEKTILVVDDEELVLAAHVRVLSQHFRVLSATRGEQALSIARSDKIDVLVTDMVMPGMSGKALFQAIRKSMPDLPVLMLSGYTEEALSSEEQSSDVIFMSKPVPPNELISTVLNLLQTVSKKKAQAVRGHIGP